jgi:protein-disulfide isomerase
MRRFALTAAIAALAVSLPVVAQPQRTDWSQMLAATPEGGLRIGNPQAAVKIIEYGSFTCGHCGAFHREGVAALKARYIASGRVSYEFRSFIRNAPDLAASLLVICQPAAGQSRFLDALMGAQEEWIAPYQQVKPADLEAVSKLPEAQQPARIAELGGLDRWAGGKGLDAARVRACLSDAGNLEKVVQNRREAIEKHGLEGTPTFVLNGRTVAGSYDWKSLEPVIVAALK